MVLHSALLALYPSLPPIPIHQHTAGHDALASLADRGNEALFAVHGKYYEAGCIPCVLYTASGTSLDWALGVAGIPYVYRCKDTSTIVPQID